MTAANCLIPNIPRFEMVKVPPCNIRMRNWYNYWLMQDYSHQSQHKNSTSLISPKYKKTIKVFNYKITWNSWGFSFPSRAFAASEATFVAISASPCTHEKCISSAWTKVNINKINKVICLINTYSRKEKAHKLNFYTKWEYINKS